MKMGCNWWWFNVAKIIRIDNLACDTSLSNRATTLKRRPVFERLPEPRRHRQQKWNSLTQSNSEPAKPRRVQRTIDLAQSLIFLAKVKPTDSSWCWKYRTSSSLGAQSQTQRSSAAQQVAKQVSLSSPLCVTFGFSLPYLYPCWISGTSLRRYVSLAVMCGLSLVTNKLLFHFYFHPFFVAPPIWERNN